MECQKRRGYIVQIDSFQEQGFIESIFSSYKGKTAETEINQLLVSNLSSIYILIEKQSMLS